MTNRFGVGARLFHWLVVLLLLVQIPAGIAMIAPGLEQGSIDVLFILHKGLGVVLLASDCEGKVGLLRRQFLTSLETLSCGGPFVQPVIDNTQIVVCTDVVAVGPDGCLVCGGCLVQVIGFEGTVTFGPEPTSLGVPRFRKCLCYFNPIGSYGFRSMVTVFWNFQPVFPTELPAWFNLSASPLLRENR